MPASLLPSDRWTRNGLPINRLEVVRQPGRFRTILGLSAPLLRMVWAYRVSALYWICIVSVIKRDGHCQGAFSLRGGGGESRQERCGMVLASSRLPKAAASRHLVGLPLGVRFHPLFIRDQFITDCVQKGEGQKYFFLRIAKMCLRHSSSSVLRWGTNVRPDYGLCTQKAVNS